MGIVKKVRSINNNKIYACKIVKTREDETIFNVYNHFLLLIIKLQD